MSLLIARADEPAPVWPRFHPFYPTHSRKSIRPRFHRSHLWTMPLSYNGPVVQALRTAIRYSHLAVDVGTRYLCCIALRLGILPSPRGFRPQRLAVGYLGSRHRIFHFL